MTVAVPDRCLEVVAGYYPCYMTVGLPCDSLGGFHADASTRLQELASGADVVGIGPGMSRGEGVEELVVNLYREFERPMIVDADALNALASLGLSAPAGPRVLTPHVGEFRRLARDTALSPEQCRERSSSFAQEHGIVLLLKGHRTLITDGKSTFENSTGNPGMATGGSGDVLTGVIAALLAQGLSSLDAARFGAHVHGVAGDFARDRVGEVSLDAEDVIACLPRAFQVITQS